ncbi:MAG: helix-turn-helix transcriptional regulator [Candidatus Riflebacteria bacterium]|nr:helix-turn-helix transcriptional regulator [Candidatus Riflebacteria bacterium]
MNYFQKKLKLIMQTKKLKQKDLAEMTGLAQTTISSWLTKDAVPKVSSVEPLAKALGLTVGDLIGDFGAQQELLEEDKRFIALPLKRKRLLLKILDAVEEE